MRQVTHAPPFRGFPRPRTPRRGSPVLALKMKAEGPCFAPAGRSGEGGVARL